MAGLTAKQQRFVLEFLVDLNATQAAIRAGYSKKTAQAISTETLSKPLVAQAIAEAQAKTQERLEYTADQWRRDTMIYRDDARQNDDITNTLKAQDMLGKSLGIYTEGRNHRSPDGTMTPTTIVLTAKPLADDDDS